MSDSSVGPDSLEAYWRALISGETPRQQGVAREFRLLERLHGIRQLMNDDSTAGPVGSTNRHRIQSTGTLAPGTFLDGYEVTRVLGRGGMSIVYAARQLALDREVALKLVRTGPLATPDALRRFESEVAATAALQHPGIVSVYDTGIWEGYHYFSMQLIEGATLAAMLRDGPIDINLAAELVRDIADAVHYAHLHGVLHRDLKPSNVIVAEESGKPFVADFGLAKTWSAENMLADNGLTQSGQLVGTPSYMSPEQATGNSKRVSPASDVYALGAILYELVTGRAPFRAATTMETIRQVIDSDPVSPRSLNPVVPGDMETICLKCLSKSPAARYPSAQALQQDLERFLAKQPIQARPTSKVERVLRWASRNRALSVAMTSFILALLAGTIVSTALWLKSERSAKLANSRNESLLASQEVMKKNQRAIREALSDGYYSSTRDRNEFVQLPTSVRNTTLISMRQANELMFKIAQDDPDTLREIAEDLASASEMALSIQMELRANELSRLNRQMVDRLLDHSSDPPVEDLLLSARVYNNLGETIRLFQRVSGYADAKLALEARDAYLDARSFSEAAKAKAPHGSQIAEAALLQHFRAKRGMIQKSPSLKSEDKRRQLELLASEIVQIDKSDALLDEWLRFQIGVTDDLARLSPADQVIMYRQRSRDQLRQLLQRHPGNVDSWLERTWARNVAQLGNAYADAGESSRARRCFEEACSKFQFISSLYSLNSYYRLGYFESLMSLADCDWSQEHRDAAAERYEQAISQIHLLIQLNPQDPNLPRRASAAHATWAERLVVLGRTEEAALSFFRGAEYSQRAADNRFRLNPDDPTDNETTIELLTKAIANFEASGLTEQAANAREWLENQSAPEKRPAVGVGAKDHEEQE